MQEGNLVISDVQAFTSRVVVDGIQRPHASWSVNRELSGDLPAQIVASSGITQATGSVVWAASAAVQEPGDNPWNPRGWWPRKGAAVEIFVSDGATEWKQFVGLLDSSTGQIGGEITSTLIDAYDRLSARISHDALLRIMPPLSDGAAYRGAGLVSTYYVDLAMRTSGFYTTPNRAPGTCLFVPFQGGAWPHVGTLSTAFSFDDVELVPTNKPVPWGFGIGNARLTYLLHRVEPASVPVQITLMVAPSHADGCNVDITYSSGRWVRLIVSADRSVTARSGDASTIVDACTLTATQMNGATVVTMLVKGGVYSLRNDKGETASGAATAPSGTTETVTVNAFPGAAVGGLMVNYANAEYLEHSPSRGFVPTAIIGTSSVSQIGTMGACRAIEPSPSIDLLTEISEALIAAMWIDELGVLRWEPSNVLRAQSIMGTVNTRDHILSMNWEDSLLGARSNVTVKLKEPSISISRYQSVAVWRGDTATLGSGETKEDILSPPADEAWVMVDTDYKRVGNYQGADYNGRRGSFMGAVYTKDGAYQASGGMPLETTMSKIGPAAWKLSHIVGILPAGVQAETRTPDDSEYAAGYYSWNKNNSLPLVGAGGLVQWYESEVATSGPAGPGSELVHDAGIWAAPSIAQNIAQLLQAQTTVPQPTIPGLSIVPDPRLQLADTVLISSPDLLGVDMRCLVTSISSSFSAGDGYSQSLAARIASVTRTSQTYAEYNESLTGAGLTYQQWQALGPIPETYSQFNSIS